MKKTYLIAILVFAVCAFSSCSNDKAMSVNNDPTVSQSLYSLSEEDSRELDCIKSQISVLSDDSFGGGAETRGFWKKFRLFFRDAAGFFKSIAGGGSYKQAIASGALASLESLIPQDTDTSTGGSGSGTSTSDLTKVTVLNGKTNVNLVVSPSKSTSLADSAGLYHNKIIRRTAQNASIMNRLLTATTKEIVDTVARNTEIELSLKPGTITSNSSIMNALLKDAELFKQLRDSLSSDEIITSIANSNPKEAKVLSLIKEYTDGIKDPEDSDKNQEYTEHVLSIIEESSLSEEMKTALKGSIAVGYASSNLWNTNADEVK